MCGWLAIIRGFSSTCHEACQSTSAVAFRGIGIAHDDIPQIPSTVSLVAVVGVGSSGEGEGVEVVELGAEALEALFEPLLNLQKDEALTGLARGFAFRMVEGLGDARSIFGTD